MRNKILEILQSTNEYISGEDLSRRLGISRAGIWKHMKKLKSEGYEIVSVTNKGYHLSATPDAISSDAVSAQLNTRFIARNILCLNETDSTNEEAKRNSKMPDGTLFVSDIQTTGKGRLGRSWSSPRGTGIWMSLLLKPDIALAEAAQITLIAGIAVCRAVGHGAKIKWPNDIVIGSRKVCGILTEMSAEIDRINYVICGIGINVNTTSFPEDLKDKATSLLIETNLKTPRAELTAAVMNEFEPLYDVFIKKGFGALRDQYRRECITLDRDIQVIYRRETVTGRAVDIDSDGGLVVKTDSGTITVTSGEVSVRGIYGYI